MEYTKFPSHFLCHSLLVSPSHVTPLVGGWSRSWLHPPPNISVVMQTQHGPDRLNNKRAGSSEDRSVRPGSDQEPDRWAVLGFTPHPTGALRCKLNMGRIGWTIREPDRVKTDRLGLDWIKDRIGEPNRRAESTKTGRPLEVYNPNLIERHISRNQCQMLLCEHWSTCQYFCPSKDLYKSAL